MPNEGNGAAATSATQEPAASAQEPQAPQQPADTGAAQTPPVDSGASAGGDSQPAGGSRTYTQDEVDRTVKARIDKQNEKHREALADAKKAADDAAARAKAAEEKVAELEAAQARAKAVSEAATKAGVSAEVLGRMSGETAEEIEANAAILAAAMPKAAFPNIPDNGNQPAPTVTKEDIDKIKNPREQLEAIKENQELFR